MFSPKELEGEVDHSFFDSDGEAGKVVHQCPEETQNPQLERSTEEDGKLEAENQGRESKELEEETLKEDLSHLRIQSEPDGHSKWTSEAKENPSGNNVVKDKEGPESGREDSDASSRKSSSLPSSDRSKSRKGSRSDDLSSVRSYSSLDSHSDSSPEDGEDEAVLKNDDESESDEREKTLERPLIKRHSETSRKSPGKFRNRSRSHSPSSSSTSSECESSNGGDGRRPGLSHKPSFTQATSSPRRWPRSSSANQRERVKVSDTVESEDTVTDVTPLSTPDISPGQSFDLTSLTEPTVTAAVQEQEIVTKEPSVTEVDSEKRRSSDTDGEERSVLSAGRRVDSALVITSPSSASSSSCISHRQKNYSFTNDEVQRIERENQRLLRELSRSSPRLRREGSARSAAAVTQHGDPPTARMYHSTLNRQREQQRIQRENLALLKRLESVKPTRGMTRAEQLADYQRQAGYLGIPAPLSRPPSGKGSRPCSSNSPRKARSETAKSSRSTASRPAWS
uniref:Cilia- and flagella-associated protein 97 n=1 Tax=Astyanax mexicanus TaxID=7994 RepID=A0A8B9HL42_ASTMX